MSKVLKNSLAEYGYNLVKLPKEGIEPLLLLYKNKRDVNSGGKNIDWLFAVTDSPLPSVSKNNVTVDIQENALVSYNGELGLKLLEQLLEKLKMGNLSGKLDANSMHSIQIRYQDVLEDNVSVIELDSFISGSEPDVKEFNSFKEKLKDSDLYVINSVLKSNSFSISAQDENGQKVDLEAKLKGVVDADVHVGRSHKDEVVLKHEKATPIVFAFKAQRIIYDHKKWWQLFKKKEAKFRIKDQQGVVLKDESSYPTQPLNQNDELIDI